MKRKIKNTIGKDFYDFLNHGKNYVTAGLFNQSLSIITVPIFTRLLVPSDYGILAILTSFVAIFSIIFGLGIEGSVTRYYFEKTNDFNQFLGSTISLLIVWGVSLSFILFFLDDLLLSFFQVPVNIIYIGIVIIFFKAYFRLYTSYLKVSKQSKKVATLTIIQRIVSIIISVVLILQLQNDKYYGRAFAMMIIAGGMGIYSLYHLKKLLKVTFKKKYLKYSLVFSLPIVLHFLSQYILGSFDLVIINQIVGKAETGLYSLAYSIGMIQSMVSMGLLRAWTPEFYEKLNSRNYNGINSIASKFARIVYVFAFLLILFSREMIIVLADKKYYVALDIVPIVIISYVFFFLYTMYVNFAFYHKKTYLIAIITIVAGGINIGLNYWLIPLYGYKVAAWTTLVSYACLFVLHYFNVRFIIKPEWITKLKVLLPNFFIMIGFVLLYTFVNVKMQNIYLLFVMKVLLLLGLLVIYFGRDIKHKFSPRV
ncbi:MAG: oligosaccharide flippase family protein [Bacteroidales bacterium]|nr:oligosaccharide flippase family protein [Bacteroidales bacterium]